jgi:two-component system NtrC family response regulator
MTNILVGHVLLVDDEPAFQRLGSAWLQNLGHQVSVAGDTDTALQKFSQSRPDVILLDLAMPPSMDPEAGISLIARFMPAPVIVITGHADRDLALRATSEGAWDFLAKPIDPDILSIVVGRAVQKAKLEQELARYREERADNDFGISATPSQFEIYEI